MYNTYKGVCPCMYNERVIIMMQVQSRDETRDYHTVMRHHIKTIPPKVRLKLKLKLSGL